MNAIDPGPHTRVLMGIVDEERKRRDPRITQQEIADAAGVHQGQVSRLLAGKRPVSYDQIHAIATLLGITTADLVRRAEYRIAADEQSASEQLTPEEAAARYDAAVSRHAGEPAGDDDRDRSSEIAS